MQHVRSLNDAQLDNNSIVTIGAFDGVHRGHAYLIGRLLEHAGQQDLSSVVITFYPHPDVVLRGVALPYYLTLPDEKASLLNQLGVDVVVTHPFDDSIRHIRAEQFVNNLIESLKMASLWVGEDFALGYQREGNVSFLRAMGAERGFDVQTIDLMDAGGERVSSSRIREALSNGHLDEVHRLLGRNYVVSGEVVQGAQRGRTIGIPTANLAVSPEKLLPSNGVYVAWTILEGEKLPSVVNIGVRPTFDGSGPKVHIESHILEFSGDIYGADLSLEFLHHLRPEKKFDGIDQLVAQIHEDIQQAKALIAPPATS